MSKHHYRIKNILNPRVWAFLIWIWLSENFHWFSSAFYLKVLYFIRNKSRLNLKNPQTFDEKINWLKLHVNITPQCTMMVDKYGVRDFIKEKIGEEYLIPLLTPLVVPNWEDMKHLAGILSAGFPHLRVDFYNINGKIYFEELTFHHDSGIVPFEPEEWDYKLGDMIKL